MSSHRPTGSAGTGPGNTGPRSRTRIALAHDWLCGYRGGEAVLDRLARLVAQRYHPAGLYVMVDDQRHLTNAIARLPHITSPLQRIPGASGPLRRWALPLYPWAVEALARRLAYDHGASPIKLLMSTSSAAIKGLRPPPDVPHLCYCHSPARYVWSQTEPYGAQPGASGRLAGLGLTLFADRFRRWDRSSAANVTQFLANSSHTRDEIRRCYNREAQVVFPPVRTGFFTPDPRVGRGGFWLAAGALEPYKRTDLAIRAANLNGHELVIAGHGSQARRLRAMAGPTVRFEGRVSDERLRTLYRTARLLLFPQTEDFGIVAVEAQACGLPVVAFRAGGVLDTIVPGHTGVFFEEPTTQSLLDAVERCPDPGTSAPACRANAERFADVVFDNAMTRLIDALLQ